MLRAKTLSREAWTKRRGIARALLVGLVVVILTVGAAGAYLRYSAPNNQSVSSTTASSQTSSPSSSTTSTQSSSSSSTGTGNQAVFALELKPNTLFTAPGMSVNYSLVSLSAISIPPGAQFASVEANTSDPGLTATLSASTINLQSQQPIRLTLRSSTNIAPGNYQIVISGSIGVSKSSSTFTVKVVPYLVLIKANSYIPNSLSVKLGATVVWMNLDGPTHMDNGYQDVVFQSGAQGQSPTLHQYDIWSFTFTQVGTAPYACTFHGSMHGQISVVNG